MNSELIKKELDTYLSFFPGEGGDFSVLHNQLLGDDDVCDRRNMTGHVTASGLVIGAGGKFCLIYHNFLQRYLQPGGHVDSVDMTVSGSALREIQEETGLQDVHLAPWCAEHDMPVDIDSHNIPPRPEKNEGVHMHHDFLYLFETMNDSVDLQMDEVSDVRWVTRDELGEYGDRFVRIAEKVEMYGIYAM